MGRLLHVDTDVVIVSVVGEVSRAHSTPWDTRNVVSHRGHRQLHFAWVLLRTGRYRIQPRLNRFEQREPFVCRGTNGRLRENVDGLSSPRPVFERGDILRLQQLGQVRIAGSLMHESNHVGRDSSDLQALGERGTQRHFPVLPQFDGLVTVEAGKGEPLVDKRRAVSGPDSESVAGFVTDRVTWKVKAQLPHVFGRTRTVEHDIARQGCGQWRLLVVSQRRRHRR